MRISADPKSPYWSSAARGASVCMNGVLTKMANGSAEIGLNLLKANKEVPGAEDEPTPVQIVIGVKDAARRDDTST